MASLKKPKHKKSNVIVVKKLTKKFKDLVAVDDISFSVERGEMFAFLGPNGAGKSTTIKILTTILGPTWGEIEVNGFDALKKRDEVRKSIGVIFQDHTLDDDLTAFENMEYHAVLYKIPKDNRKIKINKLLDYVNLSDRKNDLVKTFSGGMKRRLEVARGLLHSPEILFLDEPTLGLDVQTRKFVWDYVKRMNAKKGLTVFFTTHNLEEAEKIATRIAIIDKGKILCNGDLKEIKKKTKTNSLEKAFLKLIGYDIRKQSASDIDRMRNIRRMRHA